MVQSLFGTLLVLLRVLMRPGHFLLQPLPRFTTHALLLIQFFRGGVLKICMICCTSKHVMIVLSPQTHTKMAQANQQQAIAICPIHTTIITAAAFTVRPAITTVLPLLWVCQSTADISKHSHGFGSASQLQTYLSILT